MGAFGMIPARLQDLMRRGLVRAFGGTMGLQLALLGIGFLTALVLTNLLGVVEFGVYVLVTAWANVLVIPGKLGADIGAVKYCATYLAQKDPGRLSGFLQWMWRSVSLVSLLVAAVAAVLLALLPLGGWFAPSPGWWALVPLVPLLSLIQANFGAFRGLDSVYQAQLAEVLRQLLLLVAVVAGYFAGVQLDAARVLALSVLAAAVALLVGMVLLRRHRARLAPAAPTVLETSLWWRDSRALTVSSGMSVVSQRLDVLLVGGLAGPAAAGLYAVGKKAVELMSLVPTSANLVVLPRIAALHARGDIAAIPALAVTASRWLAFASILIGGGLLLAGEWFLGLFGDGFVDAWGVMAILIAAQVVNVMYGMVAMILSMSGHAHRVVRGMAAAIACQLLLSLVLVPPLGMVGAALAAAAGIWCWNLLLARDVQRLLGIGVSVWHAPRRERP